MKPKCTGLNRDERKESAEKRKGDCTITLFAFPPLRSWRSLRLNLITAEFYSGCVVEPQ
jgi:hypothetical protein